MQKDTETDAKKHRKPKIIRKHKTINIRVSDIEYLELLKHCIENSTSMSDFLRRNSLASTALISGDKKDSSFPKIDPAFTKQIAYIGNNLNQFVRLQHMNAHLKNDIETSFIALKIDSLKEAIDRLNESVKTWSHDHDC